MIESMSWVDVYRSFGFTPETKARLLPLDKCTSVCRELTMGGPPASVDARMTFLSAMLFPFFHAQCTLEDVFEIARAGNSSPAMFRVFQTRPDIGSVLHLCRPVKAAPILQLAYSGPKNLVQLVLDLLAPSDPDLATQVVSMLDNLESYFVDTPANVFFRAIRRAAKTEPHLRNEPLDIFPLVEVMPAWTLLDRTAHAHQWASRHDELAICVKNAELPGVEAWRRRAAQMMGESIEVFERIGAAQDAAIAKSNLANLLGRASWLTIDARTRAASKLFDEAVATPGLEPLFRALLTDNVASHLKQIARFGAADGSQKALTMAMESAEQLERLGERERLPFVLANIIRHLVEQTNAVDRAQDLRKAREIGARIWELVGEPAADALDSPIFKDILGTLADVYIRSTQYEEAQRAELAKEALRLASLAERTEAKDVSLGYIRAKALHVLGEHEAALQELQREELLQDIADQVYVNEILGFRCQVLRDLRERGHLDRVDATRRLAEHARANELLTEWTEAETSFLQEVTYRNAQKLGADIDLERAELVLAQVGADSAAAQKLQAAMVNAYATTNSGSSSQLRRAVELFWHIQEALEPNDRIAVGTTILIAWIRDDDRLTDCVETLRIAQISDVVETTLCAETKAGHAELQGMGRVEIEATCKGAAAAAAFRRLLASGGDRAALMLIVADLRTIALQLSNQSDELSLNPWLGPKLLSTAAHGLELLCEWRESEDLCRTALDWLRAMDPVVFRARGADTHDALVVSMARRDAAAAVCEHARRHSAAAWTLLADDRLARDATIAPRIAEALAAFEHAELASGIRRGAVCVIEGQAPVEDSTKRAPLIDDAGLDDLNSQYVGSESATVLLVPGNSCGVALVVPPGKSIADATRVDLSTYSSATVYRLLIGQGASWLSTVLEWRRNRNKSRFATGLRTVAESLWKCVFEPLEASLAGAERVDFCVAGDQRQFPWHCAAPQGDTLLSASERWRFSSGLDFATLMLGRHRGVKGHVQHFSSEARRAARSGLLMHAPFLGLPPSTALSLMSNVEEYLPLVSICDGMEDLPMARLEGDAARRAFGSAAVVLEGEQPPELMHGLLELLQSARAIHIACHSDWKPAHPWLSSLMLGPRLALFAASLRARTRLSSPVVLLSACESGATGPSAAGEGGLPQALLLAGARAVVAASWMVHDLSSLVFAEGFLTALASDSDVFAAMAAARAYTRTMTQDDLRAACEDWGAARPELRATLQTAMSSVAKDGEYPFSSPIHWAAYHVAATP